MMPQAVRHISGGRCISKPRALPPSYTRCQCPGRTSYWSAEHLVPHIPAANRGGSPRGPRTEGVLHEPEECGRTHGWAHPCARLAQPVERHLALAHVLHAHVVLQVQARQAVRECRRIGRQPTDGALHAIDRVSTCDMPGGARTPSCSAPADWQPCTSRGEGFCVCQMSTCMM